MADKKLADLTAATSLTATDLIYVQQGANSRKAPLSILRNTYDVGWGLYADAAAAIEGNAVTIPANTRTLITIDGGAGSITSYVNGSGIQWTGNAHQNVNVGDGFSIRLSFNAKKTTGSPAYVLIEHDIGTGTPNIVGAQEQALRQDTVGHPITFNFIVYSLDTYQANGGRFYITSSAEIQVWNKRVLIRKDYSAGA
jgi:hypothetical protein